MTYTVISIFDGNLVLALCHYVQIRCFTVNLIKINSQIIKH